jgi:hypothetical protein
MPRDNAKGDIRILIHLVPLSFSQPAPSRFPSANAEKRGVALSRDVLEFPPPPNSLLATKGQTETPSKPSFHIFTSTAFPLSIYHLKKMAAPKSHPTIVGQSSWARSPTVILTLLQTAGSERSTLNGLVRCPLFHQPSFVYMDADGVQDKL